MFSITLRKLLSALSLALLLSGATVGSVRAQDAPKPANAPPQETTDKDKIAPDIKPDALWDGRKIVPFKALDDPQMVTADKADFLGDEEYILGLTVNGESRAYPTRFVWFHHFINDKVGALKTPVLITYCSVCNTGIRYDPTVDGKPLLFDFYGLYNGVAVMCERETETVWLLADGRAVKGPLTGKTLKPQPLLDTTWGQWKKRHTKTLVMSPEGPFSKFYAPKGKAEPRGYTRFPARFFQPTVTRGDLRLPPFDKVLGVAVPQPGGDKSDKITAALTALRRAYPIKTLTENGNVVNDTLGGTPVAVFLEPETVTAVAVSRRLDGKTLTFEARKMPDGASAIYDKETGTRWNVEGVGEEGTLAGKTLTPLENHLSQWYGWSAYFPETSIYGRSDPPQPGNPFASDPPSADKDKPKPPEKKPDGDEKKP